MPGPRRQPIEVRFAGYLVQGDEDECWGWIGPVTNKGHPTLGRGGKGATQMSARIVAYRLAFGAEPSREVFISCETKICLNPRHLILAGEKSQSTLWQRFRAKVKENGLDECWPWTDKPGAAGYGRLSTGRGSAPVMAHRVAWELANGPVPDGLFVRQRCGNRLCCNPTHLFLALNPLDSPEVSARAVECWLLSRA